MIDLLHLTLRQARKLVVAVIGGTVVLIGLIMLVTPGPAFVIIPIGLGILATEFIWARRLLKRVKVAASDAVSTARRSGPSRLFVLLAVGALLILGAVGFYAFWLRLPVGEGPAGPQVSAAAFGAVWDERPTVLLALGDSVTAGYGAAPGKTYVDMVARNPRDDFAEIDGRSLVKVLPNLRVMNVAVSGSDSFQHADEQIPALAPFSPEERGIVVMTTGGNDLIHWYGRRPPKEGALYGAMLAQARPWAANFEARLDTMVKGITALFPGGCEIFIGNIYDPSDGLGQPSFSGLPAWPDAIAILTLYNDAIARCAEKHGNVHLVDVHGAFLGHGFYCAQLWRSTYRADDPHYWFNSNIEDPNSRGYDALRRLFLIEIVKALGK